MDLHTLIGQATDLPKIPEVVQELLNSFNSDDVNADEIASQLSKDQTLTAKVLRMANSSHFGGNRKIGSVNDAVVFLGLNSLRTLVLASGITSSFKAPAHIDFNEFWAQSFRTAGTARWLCQFSDQELDRELAFTCGMMHNVGTILVNVLCPDDALDIHQLVEKGANRLDLETSRLGFTHVEAGAELAKRWRFPEAMGDALRHQLQPEKSDPYSSYAALLYIANKIDELNQASEDEREELMANFPSAPALALGIDLVAVLERAEEANDDSIAGMLA